MREDDDDGRVGWTEKGRVKEKVRERTEREKAKRERKNFEKENFERKN